MKNILCLVLTLGFSTFLHATNLMDIYQQALANDPIFKQAYSKYRSSREAIPQARAALLPKLTISALSNISKIAVFNQFQPIYDNSEWQINANQVLFNYKAWAQVQQAKASVKAAQAEFNDAAQNLILRTADAYFQVLLAKDTLNFAEAKKRANMRQLDEAEHRLTVGLNAITSIYEAKAAYDQSVATVISARNNQINKNENLRKLTNHVYEHIAPLRGGSMPLIKPEPNDVDVWISTGLKQNYKLFAARFFLEAARDTIKSESAGSWPIIELQGTVSKTPSSFNILPVNNPFPQPSSAIRISITIPVFQGGLVTSQTKQAQYNFQSTSDELEQSYREIVVNSRVAFNTITERISKVSADKQTIISQQNSLKSTEAHFQSGTRTMIDVVNAQQRLFEAQEQLANDQYTLINAILNLKYHAGTLSVTDLEEINAWLDTR